MDHKTVISLNDLSQRELQVAEAYIQGLSYKEIATSLGVAPTTVRTHLQKIYRKLNVSTKIELLNKMEVSNTRRSVSKPIADGQLLGLPPKPLIIVLPLNNLSASEDSHFIAAGLAEDITTRLGYLRGIKVLPRTIGIDAGDHLLSVLDICEKLEATCALTGSVQVSGKRVRVTVRLTDLKSKAYIWSHQYNRMLEDLFELQDKIASAVVLALEVALTDGEAATELGGTNDFSAWILFQKAVQAFLLYSKSDNLRARKLCEEAAELDPGFTDAHVMLAWSYWQHARSGFSQDRSFEINECRRLIDATKTTKNITASLLHLDAATHLVERNFDDALLTAEKATAMGPSKVFGYTPSALVFAYSGRLEDAVELLRKSQQKLPFTPNDVVYNLAWTLSLIGEVDNAIGYAEEYNRRVPTDVFGLSVLALCYARAGSLLKARATIANLAKAHPAFTLHDFETHELF